MQWQARTETQVLSAGICRKQNFLCVIPYPVYFNRRIRQH